MAHGAGEQVMTRYPLFALPMVVCPRELVPLHIFEPRYKAMIQHCLHEQEAGKPGEFAIIHGDGGVLQPVGCVVKLLKVLKRYDDGRMDIITVGRQRVEFRGMEAADPFPVAKTKVYDDVSSDWDESLATQAFTLHRGLIQMITGQKPDEKVYAGLADLSFFIASSLGLPPRNKLMLISMQSEDERMVMLIKSMKQLIRKVEGLQESVRSIQGYWDLQKLFGGGGPSPQQSA
jgi:Lon protease-like protein